MDKQPYFSVIIPMYNCENSIGRLLDSIVSQAMTDDIEVIACDDRSTDNTVNIVKTYEDKLNIVHCQTIREFHCPGNTRQAGLNKATGQWITFIDNDDMFEDNVFNSIKKYIEDNNIDDILCCNFREFDLETQSYTRDFKGDGTDTWHHGKFYNAKSIEKYGVHFKEDLFSHEDLFFNNNFLCGLIADGKDYNYLNMFVYKWVDNKKSLSRSYFSEKYFYIETYLGDYIMSCSDIMLDFVKTNPEHRDFYVHQTMMALLHGYFYLQAEIFRLGIDEVLQDNLDALQNLVYRMIQELGMAKQDIIAYIYRDPFLYNKIKQNCFTGTVPFVECQSFSDFIFSM